MPKETRTAATATTKTHEKGRKKKRKRTRNRKPIHRNSPKSEEEKKEEGEEKATERAEFPCGKVVLWNTVVLMNMYRAVVGHAERIQWTEDEQGRRRGANDESRLALQGAKPNRSMETSHHTAVGGEGVAPRPHPV